MMAKEELLGILDQVRTLIDSDIVKVIDYSYQFNTGYTEVCHESLGIMERKPDNEKNLRFDITFINNKETDE